MLTAPAPDIEGLWRLSHGVDTKGNSYTGNVYVTLDSAETGLYRIKWELSTHHYSGLGIWHKNCLWTAWGAAEGFGLAFFEVVQQGFVRGRWIGVESTGQWGEETIRGIGAESFIGQYPITGIRPRADSHYSGNITFDKSGSLYTAVWDVTPIQYTGIGIKQEEMLALSFGRFDYGFAKYVFEADVALGKWARVGARKLNVENWAR